MRNKALDSFDRHLARSISSQGRITFLILLRKILVENRYSMKYIRANFLDNYIEIAEERVPIVLKTYILLIPLLRVKTSDQRVIGALEVILKSF